MLNFLNFLIVLCIVLGIAPFVLYFMDSDEMQKMNCTRTGQSRVETILMPVTVIVNNMPITNMVPTLTTTYQYSCTDGERWR
uniref:Uncharacterized protein n=1 Tax=Escherichia phage fEgEco12 TaxID=3158837 RepID=A0AAU7PG91_9CAUD